MKRAVSVVVAIIFIGLIVIPAGAYDVAQKVGVGFNIGGQKYRGEADRNENSKFGLAREVYIRYGLSSNVSTLFNYSLVKLKSDDYFETEISPAMEFKLLFSAFPEKRFTPFVFTGAGLIDFTPRDPQGNKFEISEDADYGGRKAMVLLGFGVEYFLNEYVALNATVDTHLPFTDQLDGFTAGDWDDGYWGGKVGITFFAGSTDSDGDGIPNKHDADPKHAEDFDDFEDDDGAPELDNDHDGIPDMYDWAPNAREDVDGFRDWDGAPDYDNDNDGVPDDKDRDPIHPEDFDSYEDKDGAPDYDNDNDRIPDVYDGAANEPEVFNDYIDWDGVPDEVVRRRPEPEPVKVDIMPEKVGEKIVLRGVNFETGSDKLTLNSYAILDDVVEILREHAEIELEIQGHTDSQGNDAYNKDLSQRRADSVRNYLLQKGITAYRLKAIGYGEQYPIASNDTADGRALNRRVEFLRTK